MCKGGNSLDRLRKQDNAFITGGSEDTITNDVPFRIRRLLQNRESEIDQLLKAVVVNISAKTTFGFFHILEFTALVLQSDVSPNPI
jgi:hypothetical protein